MTAEIAQVLGVGEQTSDEVIAQSMELGEMVDIFNMKARSWNTTMSALGALSVKHLHNRTDGFTMALSLMRLTLYHDAVELIWFYTEMRKKGLKRTLLDTSGKEVSVESVEAINEFRLFE